MNLQYYFQEVKKLLENNNYQVTVHRHKNKIVVSYPLRIEQPSSASFQSVYYISKQKLYFKLLIDNKVIIDSLVDVPAYVYKGIIISNIIKNCLDLEYHTEFIRYYDNIEVSQEDFWQLELLKLSLTDNSKQNALCNIMTEIINEVQTDKHDIEKLAIDLDIYEGYVAIAQLWGRGPVVEKEHNN